jgi:hypothetical protein
MKNDACPTYPKFYYVSHSFFWLVLLLSTNTFDFNGNKIDDIQDLLMLMLFLGLVVKRSARSSKKIEKKHEILLHIKLL